MKIREAKERRERGKDRRNDGWKIHKIPTSAVCGFYVETSEKATFSA